MTETLRIIFVCSGNICRSPMAEAIANDLVESYDLSAVVISAGTMGIVGREPALEARRALGEIDLEPAGTRSQGVSPALARHADFLAVMEPEHQAYLEDRLPDGAAEIVRLWEYAEEAPNDGIADPVGEEIETFRRTRDLLYECIENWFDELSTSA